MFLASTLQIMAGVDFVVIEYTKFSHIVCKDGESIYWCAYQYFLGNREAVWIVTTYEVDVATYIIVGAIDLILQVLHTLILVLGMIIVWLANAFIFGEDGEGTMLNPISLLHILQIVPFIGNLFVGVHGIDENIIRSLDLFLTAIDNLFYSIANGFFSGISMVFENIARGVLGRRKA
jgi:hypothetical protein